MLRCSFAENYCDTGTFSSTHRRFREGTLFAMPQRAEQPQRILSPAMEENILRIFHEDPKTSTRRVAAQLPVSHWNVWNVLNREKMHPFHTLQVQELQAGDRIKRLEFCRIINDKVEEDAFFIENILWSDECTFTRAGFFNTHNDHTWAVENPRAIKETRPQRRFSVNVWAGILNRQLIGPYIFEETLNSAKYLDFLKNDLPILLENVQLRTRRCLIFQQDGAPPHSTNAVKNFLNTNFREPWIGRNGPICWPPRSPDLTPMDFFLWGYMKEEIYSTPIITQEELIGRVFLASRNVQEKMNSINLVQETKRRINMCIHENGGHFEQLLK